MTAAGQEHKIKQLSDYLCYSEAYITIVTSTHKQYCVMLYYFETMLTVSSSVCVVVASLWEA